MANMNFNLNGDKSGVTAFVNVVKDGVKTNEVDVLKDTCAKICAGEYTLNVYMGKDADGTSQPVVQMQFNS